MDYEPMTWKQYIVVKPSLYVNLQNYIKDGKTLLSETDFDELDQGDKIRRKIQEHLNRALKLLGGRGV